MPGMQLTQSLKTFSQTIVKSLTDLNFYAEILNTQLRFSLKILLLFYLLLGAILAGIFTLKDVPRLQNTLDETRAELIANYPENLVFDWQNEQLSSNWPEPVVVPFPSTLQPLDTAPKNLAIIDTTIDDAPANANSLIYITRSKLFVNSMQGNWTDAELKDLIENESIHIDKTHVIQTAESSKTLQNEALSFLPWLAFLLFSIGTFFFRLLSTLLNALIVQLVFQIMNKKLSYKKVFQLCLHALIPAELIYQISILTFPNLTFPMFGLAFWLIMSLVVWHLRNLHVVRLSVDKDTPSKNK